jgi:hypothetical protein
MQAISILKRAIVVNEGYFRLVTLLVFFKPLSFFDMLIMIGEGFGT